MLLNFIGDTPCIKNIDTLLLISCDTPSLNKMMKNTKMFNKIKTVNILITNEYINNGMIDLIKYLHYVRDISINIYSPIYKFKDELCSKFTAYDINLYKYHLIDDTYIIIDGIKIYPVKTNQWSFGYIIELINGKTIWYTKDNDVQLTDINYNLIDEIYTSITDDIYEIIPKTLWYKMYCFECNNTQKMCDAKNNGLKII